MYLNQKFLKCDPWTPKGSMARIRESPKWLNKRANSQCLHYKNRCLIIIFLFLLAPIPFNEEGGPWSF